MTIVFLFQSRLFPIKFELLDGDFFFIIFYYFYCFFFLHTRKLHCHNFIYASHGNFCILYYFSYFAFCPQSLMLYRRLDAAQLAKVSCASFNLAALGRLT